VCNTTEKDRLKEPISIFIKHQTRKVKQPTKKEYKFTSKRTNLNYITYQTRLSMSCNPAGHFLPTATALIMKPLMLAKDEPDCEAGGGDHVSESNYDDRQHSAVYKSSLGINDDVDSDNEVSNDVQHQNSHHSLAHHLRTTNVKLEAALMEFSEGLNLINKPNSNTNDDNNNTSSSYNSASTTSNNDNNNNNTSNSVKGDGINKAPRKLFECDVCNVSTLAHVAIFNRFMLFIYLSHHVNDFHLFLLTSKSYQTLSSSSCHMGFYLFFVWE
jgi:hypothetical protein